MVLVKLMPGAPSMADGQEFVFYLWTSKSGLRQLIGLSQGLFNVSQSTNGPVVVSRSPSSAQMVDASGQPVVDSSFSMPLTDMRVRVISELEAAQ